jgi:hypothetical protein
MAAVFTVVVPAVAAAQEQLDVGVPGSGVGVPDSAGYPSQPEQQRDHAERGEDDHQAPPRVKVDHVSARPGRGRGPGACGSTHRSPVVLT